MCKGEGVGEVKELREGWGSWVKENKGQLGT